LRRALEREEFELFYQPQVDIASGHIIGMEALLRWRQPDLGMVLPERFIPLAEATGLIVPIGEWVLRAACAQAKVWNAAGYTQLSIAVNLSARQFHRQDVPDLVRRVLDETGLPANQLELELTESTLMQDTDNVVQTLCQLKALGIALSMDDFGTGYSSLSYLRRFPLDVLKIDRSFIADLPDNRDAMALTRTIIAMAVALNLRTIAEGVETQGQLAFLSANACDAAQGYYFSPPLPVAGFTALLREGKRLIAADLSHTKPQRLATID
jgi:EAL domain-containing protein (putative c-di-GMP-specific phosphodiesterase class I)